MTQFWKPEIMVSEIEPNFFQGLGKNTCLLQLHWKPLHPAFKPFGYAAYWEWNNLQLQNSDPELLWACIWRFLAGFSFKTQNLFNDKKSVKFIKLIIIKRYRFQLVWGRVIMSLKTQNVK